MKEIDLDLFFILLEKVEELNVLRKQLNKKIYDHTIYITESGKFKIRYNEHSSQEHTE